jgi:hypothetical protein
LSRSINVCIQFIWQKGSTFFAIVTPSYIFLLFTKRWSILGNVKNVYGRSYFWQVGRKPETNYYFYLAQK